MNNPSPSPTKRIGIVGCSAPGAALCFTTICTESADLLGAHRHPEVLVHTPSFDRYLSAWRSGDWEGVGELMALSAEILVAAGADILVCPDNTVHEAFDRASAHHAERWIHIADAVSRKARLEGYSRVGILGTRQLVEGPVYRERMSRSMIESVTPDESARNEIDRIIVEELVYGRVEGQSLRFVCSEIQNLARLGCDAVVLGCTELPLLVQPADSVLPTLDSTRLLARAAIGAAIDAARKTRGVGQPLDE